jgi:Na+/H+ antiporter NhaD/arsenite permease-like protein
MNPWDLLTWVSAVALIVSAIMIFIYFLRDAREYIEKERQKNTEKANSDR